MKPANVTCPDCCGTMLHVYKSVRKAEGLLYRYRICPCGCRFMLRERTIAIGEPFVISKKGRQRPKVADSSASTIPTSAN